MSESLSTDDTLLGTLGATRAIVAAPMAGGPSTPGLVAAAAEVGAIGLLAGGYKTPAALGAEIEQVRAATDRFGVNLFAPNPVPVDRDAYEAYASQLQPLGERYGVDTRSIPVTEDDDAWEAKVALVAEARVPVVSMTFGLPSAAVVETLHAAGALVVQTVTRVDEARLAHELGVDALVVQGADAGGHSGVLDPRSVAITSALPSLVADVRAAVPLPVWAAGGIGRVEQVRDVLDAGAEAAVVGTVLLRAHESGANATHQAALADPDRHETVVTTAFSGRPARSLRNAFADAHADAPLGYPALHHLVGPIRKAAAAAGDAESTNLWAGTAFREARDEPAGVTLERLTTFA